MGWGGGVAAAVAAQENTGPSAERRRLRRRRRSSYHEPLSTCLKQPDRGNLIGVDVTAGSFRKTEAVFTGGDWDQTTFQIRHVKMRSRALLPYLFVEGTDLDFFFHRHLRARRRAAPRWMTGPVSSYPSSLSVSSPNTSVLTVLPPSLQSTVSCIPNLKSSVVLSSSDKTP